MKIEKIDIDGKKVSIEVLDKIFSAKINKKLVSNVIYKTNANYKGRKAKTKQKNEIIEYLPKGAVVTNVARGDIVDDDALIDALNRRKVYAVGLDVYKGEPNLNPGYLKHKSAFILPHLGSATKETRTAMANLAIDNLEDFFKTGKCKNKVN